MLYKIRPAEEAGSVTLDIQKIGYDGNPIDRPFHIEKYKDFASRPFEELYVLFQGSNKLFSPVLL